MKVGAQTLTVLTLLLALCPYSVPGQTTTSGAITGVVTDISGAVVPRVAVVALNNGKANTQATTTNEVGLFTLSFLEPGSYSVMFARSGFDDATRNVDVPLGSQATLNVVLQIAVQHSTVEVTEETPVIRAENGDATAIMNRQQIDQLPNPGNDRTYIVQTAPGMIMNTDYGAGNFSNLGMPGTSNLFTVNGMTFNDFGVNVNASGALGLTLGTNEVEEAAVVSNGYSGQFGGAAGANVNYITRSGGNKLHGNAKYYWNGRILNANDWFNNATGTPRQPDNVNQWAASLGGPIKRDKLFFFLNTEGAIVLIPSPPSQVVLPSPQFADATINNIDAIFGPSSASDGFYRRMFNLYTAAPGASRALPGDPTGGPGCGSFQWPDPSMMGTPCAVHFSTSVSRPSDQALVSGRIDWNFNKGDRAFLVVQYEHGNQASYTDTISPLFNANTQVPTWQGQLIETHVFGPHATNQFLVGAWWQGAVTQPANLSRSLAAFPTTLFWNDPAISFTSLGGEDNSFPNGRNATHFQVSDDFTSSAANHKVAFGATYLGAYVSVLQYSQNIIGSLSPGSLNSFFQGGVGAGYLNGTDPSDVTALAQAFTTKLSQRFSFSRLGLYSQDEWHARADLTLVFALRLEHQSNPICKYRCFSRLKGPWDSVSHDPAQPYNQALLTDQKYAFPDFDNLLWSPRVSFAWQPFGVSCPTVLRGGFGVYFDPLPAALISFFSSNPPDSNSYLFMGNNLTPGETTSLFKDAAATNVAFTNGVANGETLAQIQQNAPSFATPGLTVPGRKMYSPQYQKWSLEIQRALATGSSITVGYYGNHGFHELVQNPSANAFGFGSLPMSVCTTPAVPPCSDQRFSNVTVLTTVGVSNYNGLVASFEHRFNHPTRGLFQANYAFGHGFDEVSNGGISSFTAFASRQAAQDPNSLRGNYGPSEYDVRHSFNANYLLELPIRAALRGHGPELFVRGWQVAGTAFLRTGFPYTVFDCSRCFQFTNQQYFSSLFAVPAAPVVSRSPCGAGAAYTSPVSPCQPPQLLANGNPDLSAHFLQAGCESGFNAGNLSGPMGPCTGRSVSFTQGRNQFRGPRYFNLDFTVMKETKLPRWENATIGIGVQFFNLLNHPNFGLPVNDIANPQFGQINYLESPPTTILGPGIAGDTTPRMIQLKLSLQF